MNCSKWLKETFIPWNMKAIILTEWKTDFDVAESDLCNSRMMGQADSLLCSHPSLFGLAARGLNMKHMRIDCTPY